MNRVKNERRQQGLLKPLLADNRGEMFYELIIKMLIVVTLILTVITVYQVFIEYQQTNYLCRRVARAIEVEGAVSSEVTSLFNSLKTELKLPSATMNVSNVSYFDPSTRRIQLRSKFTVTIVSVSNITIFTPQFSPPLIIPITLTSTLSGMSEVFWKT
jgi:hypothetical protein